MHNNETDHSTNFSLLSYFKYRLTLSSQRSIFEAKIKHTPVFYAVQALTVVLLTLLIDLIYFIPRLNLQIKPLEKSRSRNAYDLV